MKDLQGGLDEKVLPMHLGIFCVDRCLVRLSHGRDGQYFVEVVLHSSYHLRNHDHRTKKSIHETFVNTF